MRAIERGNETSKQLQEGHLPSNVVACRWMEFLSMQTARRLVARRFGLICLTALLASGLLAAPGYGQEPSKPKAAKKIDRESFQQMYDEIIKREFEKNRDETIERSPLVAQDVIDLCKLNPNLPQCFKI